MPGRTFRHLDLRQLPQRHHRPPHGRHQHFTGNLLRVGAQLARVAHRHAEPLAPFNGGGHHLATQRADR